jgi:hypothetical protein
MKAYVLIYFPVISYESPVLKRGKYSIEHYPSGNASYTWTRTLHPQVSIDEQRNKAAIMIMARYPELVAHSGLGKGVYSRNESSDISTAFACVRFEQAVEPARGGSGRMLGKDDASGLEGLRYTLLAAAMAALSPLLW